MRSELKKENSRSALLNKERLLRALDGVLSSSPQIYAPFCEYYSTYRTESVCLLSDRPNLATAGQDVQFVIKD